MAKVICTMLLYIVTKSGTIRDAPCVKKPNTSLHDGPIKFTVSGDSNYYLDLGSSYLYLEVKITKADGTAIDADTAVGPVNLIAHYLFKQVDVYLNDVLISNASNLYHYRAFLETLLTYNDEAKKSQLTMALFYKDATRKMDDVNDDNVRLKTTRSFIDASKTVTMICKPHSDIFFRRDSFSMG